MATSSVNKIDSNRIRQLVARYYTRKRWAVHFEVGLCKGGRRRADVVAMTMGAYIVIVEVKSSPADFKSDHKWHEYLKYSNQFYFALTDATYSKVKDLIPVGVGVMICTNSKVKVVKKARRSELHGKTKLNMVTRLAYRSADATKFERKSKTAGRKYVAAKVVDAIGDLPKPRSRKQVLQAAETALTGFV